MKGIRRYQETQWISDLEIAFVGLESVQPGLMTHLYPSLGVNILPVLHDTLINISVDTILEFQTLIQCTVQTSTYDTMCDTEGRN